MPHGQAGSTRTRRPSANARAIENWPTTRVTRMRRVLVEDLYEQLGAVLNSLIINRLHQCQLFGKLANSPHERNGS